MALDHAVIAAYLPAVLAMGWRCTRRAVVPRRPSASPAAYVTVGLASKPMDAATSGVGRERLAGAGPREAVPLH